MPVPGLIDEESGLQVYDVTQGDATLAGLELSLQYHPTSALHLEGTADFVRGQNTTIDAPLAAMPPFRATYRVRYEAPDLAAWALAPYLWIGGESYAKQTRLDPSEEEFFAAAFDGAGFTPMAYTLVNIGAGITLSAGATPLQLDLRVRNLFDTAHAPQLSRLKTNAPLPGMGRALQVGIRAAFGH